MCLVMWFFLKRYRHRLIFFVSVTLDVWPQGFKPICLHDLYSLYVHLPIHIYYVLLLVTFTSFLSKPYLYLSCIPTAPNSHCRSRCHRGSRFSQMALQPNRAKGVYGRAWSGVPCREGPCTCAAITPTDLHKGLLCVVVWCAAGSLGLSANANKWLIITISGAVVPYSLHT